MHGPVTDIQIVTEQMQKTKQRLTHILAENTGRTFLAELVEAMYDELFSLQSTHLCNMKQNGYQNAAFECFALMPFYDIVSFTAATAITGYRNSIVSFCNTASF